MTEVNPIQAQSFLKGANYPMSREEVVELARSNDAPREILQALQSMKKESFDGPNAVTAAMREADVTDSGKARPGGAAGPSET